jgi:hypothetical protein
VQHDTYPFVFLWCAEKKCTQTLIVDEMARMDVICQHVIPFAIELVPHDFSVWAAGK